MKCQFTDRCLKCRKLNIKRATLAYQNNIKMALSGPTADGHNLLISPFWLNSALNQRARLGRMVRNYENKKRKVRCETEKLISDQTLTMHEICSDNEDILLMAAEIRRLRKLIQE